MLTDGVVELREVNPAQAQVLAEGTCPLASVPDYPHSDTIAAARMMRDSLTVDNWIPGFGMHLIIVDGLVVGDVGFYRPPDERGAVEIGYGLAASARGRGYAARAVVLLCADTLTRPGVSTILADTTTSNPASIKVLQRCGFTRVRGTGESVRYRLTTAQASRD